MQEDWFLFPINVGEKLKYPCAIFPAWNIRYPGRALGHMGEGHMGIGHMGTGHMGTRTYGYQDIRVPGHMGTRTHGYRDIWV